MNRKPYLWETLLTDEEIRLVENGEALYSDYLEESQNRYTKTGKYGSGHDIIQVAIRRKAVKETVR